MAQRHGVYEKLARLFEYPGEDYRERVQGCVAAMPEEAADALLLLKEFSDAVANSSADDLQELFTRTFDLNPACTLEIGWHLYGEDYQRGEFLVKMRQQLRSNGIPESGELPDHLSHALALLARLESEAAAEFSARFLLPALDRMLTSWQNNRNAFAILLDSLFTLLKSRYTYEPARGPRQVPELHVLQ